MVNINLLGLVQVIFIIQQIMELHGHNPVLLVAIGMV